MSTPRLEVRWTAFLLTLAMAASFAPAQGEWLPVLTTTTPPTLDYLAYDEQRQVIVGAKANGGETWEFVGGDWSRKATAPGSVGHCLVYYPPSKACLTITASGLFRWNGSNWVNAAAAPFPSLTTVAAAFDALRGRLVVFGQDAKNDLLGAEFDGSSWNSIPVPTASSPPTSGAFHRASKTAVFGVGGLPGSVYAWDGVAWYLVSRTFVAGYPVASLDPIPQLMFTTGQSNVTWDGQTWTELKLRRTPTGSVSACAWDSARRRLVAIVPGSIPLTWEFDPGSAGSYTSFGSGCAGARGKPFLATRPGENPVANAQFNVQVNSLPLTGDVVMFMGVSKTAYGNLKLPLDLGTIGMPTCTLYTSLDLVFPVQNYLGVALWTVDLPWWFRGVTFYNQAVALDPTANAVGLIVSDGAEAKVGG